MERRDDIDIITTSDTKTIGPYIQKLKLPLPGSHKGQNGKLLIIGGSSLFHSAAIWSAEVASRFVDMVHFSSTPTNNEIMLSYKKKWLGGIVVSDNELLSYASEDPAILIGNGMMREGNEAHKARELLYRLISQFPHKRWIFDAGALQIMDVSWINTIKTYPILTPHQKEFESLFGTDVSELSREDKVHVIKETAKKYQSVILCKAVYDIVSDGEKTVVIEGGNAGLTKGGTGDILAGLTAALTVTNEPIVSCILASYTLKSASDSLYETHGTWYSNNELISHIPITMFRLLKQSK